MGWLLTSAIIGGGLSARSTRQANKAQKEADRISALQDEITKQQNIQEASITIQNMIEDLSSLESTQTAMSSAMGKRGTGGSMEAIKENQRGLLMRDIEDIERSVEQTGRMLDLQTSSRYAQSRTQSKQRWLSWGANTLTSIARVAK